MSLFIHKDALWKGIIEDYPKEFIRYFYVKADEIFDFEKGIEFLDKELEQLFPESEQKGRRADKLIKIYRKDGTELWMLLHIEVQGYEDESFALRMFIYYYRIFDKFNRPIEAIALFTDDNKKYRPFEYHAKCIETEVTYRYKSFKLKDYSVENLYRGDNPLSYVLMAARHSISIMDDKRRYAFIIDLYRRLWTENFDKHYIRRIFNFVQYHTELKDSILNEQLQSSLNLIHLENKNNMAFGLIERINEDLYNQGIEKSIEKERIKLYKAVQTALTLGLPVSQVATIFGLNEEVVGAIQMMKLEKEGIGN